MIYLNQILFVYFLSFSFSPARCFKISFLPLNAPPTFSIDSLISAALLMI